MSKYMENAEKAFEKLRTKKDVTILAVESSCDETAVSVVRNGREVLSNSWRLELLISDLSISMLRVLKLWLICRPL